MSSQAASEEILKTLREAVSLHNRGRLEDAERLYREVLRAAPHQADALHLFGILTAQRGNATAAAGLIERAISADPLNADAFYNHGNVLRELKRFDEAVASYDLALALRRDHVSALTNRGVTLQELKRPEEALESYERALLLDPSSVALIYNKANALRDLGRLEAAVAAYDSVLILAPAHFDALNNRGGVFLRMRRFESALADYERLAALNPANAETFYNRGNVLNQMGRFADALAEYQHALRLRPDFAAARQARGDVFSAIGDYENAFGEFDAAIRLDPGRNYLEGSRLHAKMHICNWAAFAEDAARLAAHVREGKRATEPFMFLPISMSAQDQLVCARTYAADRYPPNPQPLWVGEKYRHGKIRLAYISGEFREQATSYLTADLFECHNREEFELYGIAIGINDGSPMRKRLERAFDVFTDMSLQSDAEIAEFLRRSEIDILVNLNGYFGLDRTGVFAMRPVPVQVNYLGYPGTMGASYMDYIIADRYIIPDAQQSQYSERVCYLPDSYQPNDRKKAIDERVFTRAQCGLPESGIVFCCFNNNHKILPQIFAIWLRLLKRAQGSVLWLLEGNAAVRRNLTNEAERHGVPADRIVFAPMVKLSEHLARERLADVFLDTLPHNAHTTASDALWCGIPIVTCLGGTFAGRVAASLLGAVGLPELITGSLEDYESLALSLARDPALLGACKAKLARNRDTFPLFDTPRYTRYLEEGYRIMSERAERGLPPASCAIEPNQP